jgi:hypothetical protein
LVECKCESTHGENSESTANYKKDKGPQEFIGFFQAAKLSSKSGVRIQCKSGPRGIRHENDPAPAVNLRGITRGGIKDIGGVTIILKQKQDLKDQTLLSPKTLS